MKRIPALDGLRAIAVACVMAFHFIPWIGAYVPLGSIGVRLFFVLSGFLITRILLASRSEVSGPALRSFYIRRGLRIFPVFYLVLALAWALNIGPVRATIAWHIPYLTNIYLFDRGSWHGSVSHLWSLAVEEQFYLVWPWLVLFVPTHWLRGSITAMIFIAPISRLLIGGSMSSVLPTSCLDSLGCGAFVALTGTPLFHRAIGPTVFVTGLVLQSDVVLDFGVSLSAAWIVWTLVTQPAGTLADLLGRAPIVYLGTISYGIYLFHGFMPYVIGRYVPGFVEMFWVSKFALLSIATILAASISWRFLEASLMTLKERWSPRHSVPYPAERAA